MKKAFWIFVIKHTGDSLSSFCNTRKVLLTTTKCLATFIYILSVIVAIPETVKFFKDKQAIEARSIDKPKEIIEKITRSNPIREFIGNSELIAEVIEPEILIPDAEAEENEYCKKPEQKNEIVNVSPPTPTITITNNYVITNNYIVNNDTGAGIYKDNKCILASTRQQSPIYRTIYATVEKTTQSPPPVSKTTVRNDNQSPRTNRITSRARLNCAHNTVGRKK